jgi:general secretion pathway protein G
VSSKASSIKRYVPPVVAFLLVHSVLLACSTLGYHDSVRRFRETTSSQDLWVMRQSIDNFTKDRQQAPLSLQELVDGGYLRTIPTDPLTGKKDWVLHFGTVVLDNAHTTFGVDNVHSRSEQKHGNSRKAVVRYDLPGVEPACWV